MKKVTYLHPEKLHHEIQLQLQRPRNPKQRRDRLALDLRTLLVDNLVSLWNHPKWSKARVVGRKDFRGDATLFFTQDQRDEGRRRILESFRRRTEVFIDDGYHGYYSEAKKILDLFPEVWIQVHGRRLLSLKQSHLKGLLYGTEEQD